MNIKYGKRRPATARPNGNSLTLRKCYGRYYDRSDLSTATRLHFQWVLSLWERLTSDPGAKAINASTWKEFERRALKEGMSTKTLAHVGTTIRCIVRSAQPHVLALGRPSKFAKPVPRRLQLDEELGRFYSACEIMNYPRLGFRASLWWQTLAVWLYSTGQRLSDALRLRFEDIDFERGTARFTTLKTQKTDELPLHPVVLGHVRAMQTDRELVFPSVRRHSRHFDRAWRRICEHAGLPRRFTPLDLRKTAAFEINRASASKGLPPMAAVLLQHSPRPLSDMLYARQAAELREALFALRMPTAFVQGAEDLARELEERRQPAHRVLHAFPDPSEWSFSSCAFVIRKVRVRAGGGGLRIMRALTMAPNHTATLEDLASAVWPAGGRPGSRDALRSSISHRIKHLRDKLRRSLCLPDTYNAIPCIERGGGGRWTICLPVVEKGAAT